MTADHRSAEVQSLRAFVDARKRSVEEAEKRYDVPAALKELQDLAAPLLNPEQFTSTRKVLGYDHPIGSYASTDCRVAGLVLESFLS